MINPITPPRETAPSGTDKQTRTAYAICREIMGRACACEYVGNTGDAVCHERIRAVRAAEKLLVGEG
jgi:hypothetical protein